ncbi:Endonuclease/exonuclease/phosphatase [Parasponia andersonii]|uniref:Endonuclease/exonuclease/phosphatase n=1 Tax=Parasponia andersonii TaxID=3476 RepID=A0A2P5B1I1_PARAD|nr:Endonuclease/exonuclease/phosphatase [Parasponia andersonii]
MEYGEQRDDQTEIPTKKNVQLSKYEAESVGRGGGPNHAPTVPMKILSWNCRGLGQPRAVGALSALLRKEDPDCVFSMLLWLVPLAFRGVSLFYVETWNKYGYCLCLKIPDYCFLSGISA